MRPAAPPVVDLDEIPATGLERPELRPFDDALRGFLRDNGIPGGALAIARNGALIFARGYGYAERVTRTPVAPDALFRIASVSKPVTAAAVLALLEDSRGALTLDTPVVERLGVDPWLPAGRVADPRLRRITVRHLLQHSAGWDRDRSGDVMFEHFQIARDLHTASPPDHRSILRWALGRPLDFDPGSQYVYANFGYCVLGRFIEAVAGKPYETYVRERVLNRLRLPRMRLGGGRLSERLPGEVRYHTPTDRTIRSVFSDETKPVPEPYGFASPATIDAHGGWVASAVDLVRFAAVLDTPSAVLSPASVAATVQRPAPPLWRESDGRPAAAFYGLGWMVRPVGAGRCNTWHLGAMPGTTALLVRLANGNTWAALFNQRAEEEIDGVLHRAAARVSRWPAPLRPDDPGVAAAS